MVSILVYLPETLVVLYVFWLSEWIVRKLKILIMQASTVSGKK
jgi:hypothetical protein